MFSANPTANTLSRRRLLAGGLLTAASVGLARADEETEVPPTEKTESTATTTRLLYDSPQTQDWQIGVILTTPVACTNAMGTFPVPMNWPEQTITVTDKTVGELITRWEPRELAGGAKQIVFQMDRVPAGSTVELTFAIQIQRSRILAPEQTDDLVIPTRPGRDLRLYLGNSPYIDASNSRVRAASRELAATETENAWDTAENIYDYVRDKVQYVNGDIKSASEALRDGKGDCEEMTSLFVAMCRNARIPARMVWIPEHCYPEFYLEDPDGTGHWFPCQAAGTRQFGRMDEYRPVLQKGDRFKVPEIRHPTRYVAEFFRCDRQGKGNPKPEFIRRQIDV